METRQTIIYIVPSLINAGPINVVLNIVRHLDKKRFRPVVVVLQQHALAAVRGNKAAFEILGINITEYNYTYWQLQLHTNRIADLIQKEFPADAIFHAHGYYPTLLLSRFKGRKTMTTIHNICDEEFPKNKGQLMGRYMARTYKRALRNIGLCATICDTMQRYYATDERLRLATVCNGVEVPSPLTKEKREALRRESGILPGTKVLLYPAAFNVRKNHKRLISELKESPRQDFLVLFAGMGDLEKPCRLLVKDDDRFRFLGYKMDIEPYWGIADFMLSSSLSEGLPMAVLEAVVRGLPCLLSDIPPHREIAENVFGPNSGQLFPLDEEGSLRRLVERSLDRTFHMVEIREKAILHYSSQAMTKGYSLLYDEIAKTGRTLGDSPTP